MPVAVGLWQQAKAAAEYVSVAEGLGDTQSQCDAAEIMAHSSYCLNQYDDAMHWYQRSLDFCRTLKHTEVLRPPLPTPLLHTQSH